MDNCMPTARMTSIHKRSRRQGPLFSTFGRGSQNVTETGTLINGNKDQTCVTPALKQIEPHQTRQQPNRLNNKSGAQTRLSESCPKRSLGRRPLARPWRAQGVDGLVGFVEPTGPGCGGQNRFGIPFWLVGEFTTHFSGGTGDFDPWPPPTMNSGFPSGVEVFLLVFL